MISVGDPELLRGRSDPWRGCHVFGLQLGDVIEQGRLVGELDLGGHIVGRNPTPSQVIDHRPETHLAGHVQQHVGAGGEAGAVAARVQAQETFKQQIKMGGHQVRAAARGREHLSEPPCVGTDAGKRHSGSIPTRGGMRSSGFARQILPLCALLAGGDQAVQQVGWGLARSQQEADLPFQPSPGHSPHPLTRLTIRTREPG